MRNRPWLRRAVVVLLVLLAASTGFSRVLRAGRVHRYLSARLEAAFGRPVEVGRFDFNVRDGMRLEAESITVAEDPRFGHEYFLRAERLTAGMRWRSLARGRFEFGTLWFTRPSLNLVRAADGRWNVESWLPPAAPAAGIPGGAMPPGRLYRIEVDSGRINFKRGVDKHPFALVEVTGHLDQESAGRWRMDLEARPVRVAVALEQAGTLRVRGRIAGTSARLQPAELALTWQGASLADALRLARGKDYGVRGRLEVELTARTEAPDARVPQTGGNERTGSGGATGGAGWSFAGTARLQDVHRWDQPARPGDPALNIGAEAYWRLGEPRVELSRCLLEAPGSSVRATGKIEWAPAFNPQFRFISSGINLSDLLAWYRAFRPGVAEDLTLAGSAGIDIELGGWPPRLEQGALASDGARLRAGGLAGPIRVGRVAARVRRGRLQLEPTTITFASGSPGGAAAPKTGPRPERQGNLVSVEGSVGPGETSSRGAVNDWRLELALAGQTGRAQDVLSAAVALGHPLGRGWGAEGEATLRLRWQGSLRPFAATALGTIELRGLRVRASYLNQPVDFTEARIELRPGERRVTLAAARGLGARWKGSLWSRGSGQPWEFDLAADRLDGVELDRWLGPRARAGLLERIMPFVAVRRDTSELDSVLAGLRGRGRLSVDEFVLAPLSLHRLRAEVEIEGRNIAVRQAQAVFYGGTMAGWLQAKLSAQPAYHIEARFARVNLALLADAAETLKDRFAGSTSGQLTLEARGVGREELLRSLEGRGALDVRGARIRGLDLLASFRMQRARPGTSDFASASAAFAVSAQRVQFERLQFSGPVSRLDAVGSVDFSRALDLRFRSVSPDESPGPARGSVGKQPQHRDETSVHITGLLEAPRVTPIEPGVAKRGARAKQ